jgi:protein SCO1/2
MTAARRSHRAARLLAGVLIAVGAMLLSACASGTTASSTPGLNGTTGWHGTPVPRGYPLPAERFTDTHQKSVTLAGEATTPITLVFFGYTHCPDICNVVLANIAAALRESRPAVRAKIHMVFVSTDPQRDTPPVMREYLDRFNHSFEGLVAPVDTVAKAARSLYISYEKPDGTLSGNYTVQHGTYTTGFVHGKAAVVWSDVTTVADLRSDLARLTGLAASSAQSGSPG